MSDGTSDFFKDLNPVNPDGGLEWDQAREVPDEVLERFAGKQHPRKSLAAALRRKHGTQRFVIRDRNGKTFVVPRRP